MSPLASSDTDGWAPGVKEAVIASVKERSYLAQDAVEGVNYYFSHKDDTYTQLIGELPGGSEKLPIVTINKKTGDYHG
ncbi:cell division site-positioning protein MapZ family protein [Carnobacterium divergens]|uniref:cell division site-positioning protein MapZ family protein n=1 Tax=Carnobacterium divergens TaxID=2748 RepID=UPI003B97215F